MKLITIILAVAALSACGPKECLVWSDEFDSDTLNEVYWNMEESDWGGGNAEMQYYTPNNVSIENHPVTGERCLVLSAKAEDYGHRPATSARVNTKDKVTIHYGKVEARIAFPNTADGLWPAFWMLGNNQSESVVWPKCGEIDICEMGHKDGIVNGTQDRYFNGAAHWGEAFNNGFYPNTAGVKTADYPLQGSFHLFTLVWSEDSLAMYLDRDQYPETEPYFQMSLRNKGLNEPGRYFNHPFYIILNLSVGGYFTGLPTAVKHPEVVTSQDTNFVKITALPKDGTPVKMYVDYIRVYEIKH